jgi:hypothetical protein
MEEEKKTHSKNLSSKSKSKSKSESPKSKSSKSKSKSKSKSESPKSKSFQINLLKGIVPKYMQKYHLGRNNIDIWEEKKNEKKLITKYLKEKYTNINLIELFDEKTDHYQGYFVDSFISIDEYLKVLGNYRFNYNKLYENELIRKKSNINNIKTTLDDTENYELTLTVNTVKFIPTQNYIELEIKDNKVIETEKHISSNSKSYIDSDADSESELESELGSELESELESESESESESVSSDNYGNAINSNLYRSNHNSENSIIYNNGRNIDYSNLERQRDENATGRRRLTYNDFNDYYNNDHSGGENSTNSNSSIYIANEPSSTTKSRLKKSKKIKKSKKTKKSKKIALKIKETGKYIYKGYLENYNLCILQVNKFYNLNELVEKFDKNNKYSAIRKINDSFIDIDVVNFEDKLSLIELTNKIIYYKKIGYKFIKEQKYILCNPSDVFINLDNEVVSIVDLKSRLINIFENIYNIFRYPFGLKLKKRTFRMNRRFIYLQLEDEKYNCFSNDIYKKIIRKTLTKEFKSDLKLIFKYKNFFRNFSWEQIFLTNNPFEKNSLFKKNIDWTDKTLFVDLKLNKVYLIVYLKEKIDEIINSDYDDNRKVKSIVNTLIDNFLIMIKYFLEIKVLKSQSSLLTLIYFIMCKKYIIEDRYFKNDYLKKNTYNNKSTLKYIDSGLNKNLILLFQKIFIFLNDNYSISVAHKFLCKSIIENKNSYGIRQSIYMCNILLSNIYIDIKPILFIYFEYYRTTEIEKSIIYLTKYLSYEIIYISDHINNIRDIYIEKYNTSDFENIVIHYLFSNRQITYKDDFRDYSIQNYNINNMKNIKLVPYNSKIADIVNIYIDFENPKRHIALNSFGSLSLQFSHDRGQNVGGLTKDWFRINYTSENIIEYLLLIIIDESDIIKCKLKSILQLILFLGYINSRLLYFSDSLLDIIYIYFKICKEKEETSEDFIKLFNNFVHKIYKIDIPNVNSKFKLQDSYKISENLKCQNIFEFMLKKIKNEECKPFFINKKYLIAYLFYREYIKIPKEEYLIELLKYLLDTTKINLIEAIKYNTSNSNFTINNNKEFFEAIKKLYNDSKESENAFNEFLNKNKEIVFIFSQIFTIDYSPFYNSTNRTYHIPEFFSDSERKILYMHLLKNNEEINPNKIVEVLNFEENPYNNELNFSNSEKKIITDAILSMNHQNATNFLISTTGTDTIPPIIKITKTNGNIAYHTCFNHIEIPNAFFSENLNITTIRDFLSELVQDFTMAGGSQNNEYSYNSLFKYIIIGILSGTILSSSLLQSIA